jgi:ribosomal protein S18 acetylase RimI-like enzyme
LVLQESFAEYEPLYTKTAFAVTTPAPDGVLERMKEGPMWVAIRNGRIVGTASTVPNDRRLYVRGMAVIPTARGRGVGRRLLDRIEAFAVEQRFSSLFLSTAPFLREAIGLYERRGFHRTDEGPFDLFGTPLFTMEKRL